MRLLLVGLFAIAVTGCDDLNCFDDGPLEASYTEGTAAAERENALQFDAGKAAGLRLTRADGARDGERDGYDAGFSEGYELAYGAGHADGEADGFDDGATDPGACAAGTSDGRADGEADGYADSYDAGFADGAATGYNEGFADGSETCTGGEKRRAPADLVLPTSATQGRVPLEPAPAQTGADPEELRQCRARGYDSALDEFAYLRGFAEGKRENPDYQAGYREAFPIAHARGYSDGGNAGYSDGYDDGYANGYDAAFGAAYDSCYATGYDDGYDSGSSNGYDPGFSAGYSSGYSDGYDDGDDCG
jgi:flagellar biosynthesis/type III secretory pathway protein FliH